MNTAEKFKVPALQKTIQILDLLAKKGKCSIKEILQETKISRSSLYTLLADMIKHNLIKQNSYGEYTLWLKVIELGNRAEASLDLSILVRPYLKELVNKTNCLSAYYGVIENTKAYYLEKVTNTNIKLTTKSIAGAQIDYIHSGIGKCLLAFLDNKTFNLIINDLDFTPITSTSITTKEQLIEELELIRKQKWAFNNAEDDECIRSIAVPVFNKEDHLVGSISVVGTVLQLTDENMQKFVDETFKVAQNLSEKVWG